MLTDRERRGRGADRQSRFLCSSARSSLSPIGIWHFGTSRTHTALLHASTESVFNKCLTDVKCFGTPNINLVRGKSPSELCGWGQQCKVDSLTCLTSLSARFITNERMLLGQEKQSHGAWMGWLQIFTCTPWISHFVLSFGFWAWKTLYLSDRSSKTTVDCLKAMGNAFFASPTFFLPSSFYSIAPSCSSLSLLLLEPVYRI